METMIIVLSILIGVLSIMFIVVLGIITYILLLKDGLFKFKTTSQVPSFPTPNVDEVEFDRQRRQIQAEADAFQELMNFNADKAYGIAPKE